MRTTPSHYEEQTRSQPRSQVPGSEKASTSPVSSSLSFRPSFISRGVLSEFSPNLSQRKPTVATHPSSHCSPPSLQTLVFCWVSSSTQLCFWGDDGRPHSWWAAWSKPAALHSLRFSTWQRSKGTLTAARSQTGGGPRPWHFYKALLRKAFTLKRPH